MSLIARLILNALTVFVAGYIVPGIVIGDVITALVVAIVLGVANSFIKPLLHIIALPLTIMTLGLFALVINGVVVLLVASLVPGFGVAGLWSAILFSIVVSVMSAFLNNIDG